MNKVFFIGGPLDGEQRMLPQEMDCYEAYERGPIHFDILSLHDPAPVEIWVYCRRRCSEVRGDAWFMLYEPLVKDFDNGRFSILRHLMDGYKRRT